MKTALVTGIFGQDGSYLAELLLASNYRVVGATRSLQAPSPSRRQVGQGIEIVHVDPLDGQSVRRAVETVAPDEIYNLAAMSSSSHLFEDPELLLQYNALAVVRWLGAIRDINRRIRFFQAASSEIFGLSNETPQRETTCFRPRNPYGVAKLAAHLSVNVFRQMHDMHACSGILFNHESPRRGEEYVTRKICRAVAAIVAGRQESLQLATLEARRDWGFAGDYVRGMWLMLQAQSAGDYVLATGETHTVREFCEIAFRRVNLDYRKYVVTEPGLARPADAVLLSGDSSRARSELGWKPSMSFTELVHLMVEADVKAVGCEDALV
ncbi:MAG: GDP-mannose 4,6-dehydratase [Pseudomonadota bacterium]